MTGACGLPHRWKYLRDAPLLPLWSAQKSKLGLRLREQFPAPAVCEAIVERVRSWCVPRQGDCDRDGSWIALGCRVSKERSWPLLPLLRRSIPRTVNDRRPGAASGTFYCRHACVCAHTVFTPLARQTRHLIPTGMSPTVDISVKDAHATRIPISSLLSPTADPKVRVQSSSHDVNAANPRAPRPSYSEEQKFFSAPAHPSPIARSQTTNTVPSHVRPHHPGSRLAGH